MEKYFKLKKDEEIIMTANDITIMANDNKIIANIIITTKRIILLRDINKELTFNSYLSSKGVSVASNYEVTYELALSDISKMNFIDNCNKLVLKNNNLLEIYCSDFIKYIRNHEKIDKEK